VTIAVDPAGDYHIVDVWRAQTTIDKTIDALLDRCRDFNPALLCTESGGLHNAAGPFLRSRMIERKIYKAVELIPAKHSKEMRAQSLVGRAAVKGLYLPQQALWLSDFVAELISFPSAKHDDQVDALACIFQALDKIAPGRAAAEPPVEQKRLVIGDAAATTLTLTDLFEQSDRRRKDRGAHIA
jgi:predicted phage terminase large subunit-like protein